ncbi:ricin B lectin domain-containing protein [Mycena maculata]|uniref:Ricin B lectin domain-containing protein n=1 Tax=Mycena maculata TaxID=230809 RepID=A0AAD7K9Z5_9AGAR|nr:ricin B lectin domain-containing protein [Mycena maculata]
MLTALITLFPFVLSVSAATRQIQSANPAFFSAGMQGCVSAATNADGVALVIHNCNTENIEAVGWEFTSYDPPETPLPQPIVIFGDKCIDVTNGVNEDGTLLQIWTCVEGNTNQQWFTVGNTFQWSGTDKCLDLTDGVITDDNPLQIWTCTGGDSNQEWISEPDPDNIYAGIAITTFAEGGPYCIAAASDKDGAEVALVSGCFNSTFNTTYPDGNVTWNVPVEPLTGQITTFDNMCLDVTNGVNEDGTKLQIWECFVGNTNQLFKNLGDSQFEWNGSGKCIDLTDGIFVNGNPIQIWDCSAPFDNVNQDWFIIYFKHL